MSSSLEKDLGALFAKRSIVAGAIATGVATLLGDARSLDGLLGNILVIGLPTLAGADIANMVTPAKESNADTMIRFAVAGAGAAAILMAAQVIPMELSMEMVSTVALAGLGCVAGDMIMKSL